MVDCMKQRICAALIPIFALASACGPADNDPGPGGVTVGEARALDEAAAMIDQRRLPESALPEIGEDDAPKPPKPGPGETAADEE